MKEILLDLFCRWWRRSRLAIVVVSTLRPRLVPLRAEQVENRLAPVVAVDRNVDCAQHTSLGSVICYEVLLALFLWNSACFCDACDVHIATKQRITKLRDEVLCARPKAVTQQHRACAQGEVILSVIPVDWPFDGKNDVCRSPSTRQHATYHLSARAYCLE